MFNALAYSKKLEQAGFSRDQAEATINVFFQFMDYNFATKSDLSDAKSEIKSEMVNLRTELKTEISELRTELKSEVAELRTELKSEVAELRTELKSEVAELRTELKTEIAEINFKLDSLENRMTIKFGLMQAATIGILAAVIKLF
jgi:hypothetical protein